MGTPDDVALETLEVTDRGDGTTRLEARSHDESFDARDAMIAHGMADGVNAGYDKLDEVFAGGE